MSKASEEKRSYWRGVLRRQRESGLSVRQFCADEDLSDASFYRWKRKIAAGDRRAADASQTGRLPNVPQATPDRQSRTAVAAVFIPVRVQAAAGSLLEVVHPRGHVVRVPAGVRRRAPCGRFSMSSIGRETRSHAFPFESDADLSGPGPGRYAKELPRPGRLDRIGAREDPLSGHLFVFINRRRDRIKLLYWGGTGFCIWYQQLEQGATSCRTRRTAEHGRASRSPPRSCR